MSHNQIKVSLQIERQHLRQGFSGGDWCSLGRTITSAGAGLPELLLRAGFRGPFSDSSACGSRASAGRTLCPPAWKSSIGGCRKVGVLIREAFLRGISARQAAWQTVSRLTRDLDQVVRQLHRTDMEDDWHICFWTEPACRRGVSAGDSRYQWVHMLEPVMNLARQRGQQLLAFLRSQRESDGMGRVARKTCTGATCQNCYRSSACPNLE